MVYKGTQRLFASVEPQVLKDQQTSRMRQLAVIALLVGSALARPQVAARDNTFTKILSFESYQDGSQFGHELNQEDGTTSGQKFGPDGLLYGFYSYIQDDGNRVKVFWRAGEGVGYEVIGVEGLNQEGLGNLRATVSATPVPEPAVRSRPAPTPAPVRTHVPTHVQPQHQPQPQHTFRPVPARPTPAPFDPSVTFIPAAQPLDPTPAPHRFDYPAVLNLERTASGFVSSLQAV
ncbi:uncharacterized protein [Palaemon carinicauda]|uniref:uncharacterized protein n=1 Tax=Palaemon carinicauda TaxID=392227 RepID=UPI0035B599CD